MYNKTIDAWQDAWIITKRYKDGENSVEIAKDYNCSAATILKVIKSVDSSIIRSKGKCPKPRALTSKAWNDANEITERYKNGESSYALSKEYGCSAATILKIIRSVDDSIVRIGKTNKNYQSKAWDNANEIAERYKNGESSYVLSKEYGYSAATIIKIVRSVDSDIIIRDKNNKKRSSKAWGDANIITERYRNGESSKQLSKDYKTSPGTIIKIVRSIDSSIIRSNLSSSFNNKIDFTDDDVKHIVHWYANGGTLSDIAKNYNCSTRPIKRVLKENNITLRGNTPYKTSYYESKGYVDMKDGTDISMGNKEVNEIDELTNNINDRSKIDEDNKECADNDVKDVKSDGHEDQEESFDPVDFNKKKLSTVIEKVVINNVKDVKSDGHEDQEESFNPVDFNKSDINLIVYIYSRGYSIANIAKFFDCHPRNIKKVLDNNVNDSSNAIKDSDKKISIVIEKVVINNYNSKE